MSTSNIYYVKGVNGQIKLTKNRVIIARKGALGMLTQGFAGDKEIPIKNITALQFKIPSSTLNGFLQFTLQGGREVQGGVFNATQDENTVMFNKSQQANFQIVKNYIDSIIDESPLDFDALELPTEEQATQPTSKFGIPAEELSNKSFVVTFILGLLALDKFYTGNILFGILKFFTGGGCGIWWLVDLVRLFSNKYTDKNGKYIVRWG